LPIERVSDQTIFSGEDFMTINERTGQGSSLLNYLPAIFQEDSEANQPNFLGRFLLAFERILLGLGEISSEVPQPGIEEILGGGNMTDNGGTTQLAGVYRYFEPGANLSAYQHAPSDFLPWLASWVALTLRDDWEENKKRLLIARAAQLYRLRGTKRGLEEALIIYTQTGVQTTSDVGVQVNELNAPLQVGVHATIGKDTILDGGAPFFFWVQIVLPTANPELIKQQQEIVTAIVDLQKPAHTDFLRPITVVTPVFRINFNSTVGIDTLLGEPN
jgi:phage tail-like protein